MPRRSKKIRGGKVCCKNEAINDIRELDLDKCPETYYNKEVPSIECSTLLNNTVSSQARYDAIAEDKLSGGRRKTKKSKKTKKSRKTKK